MNIFYIDHQDETKTGEENYQQRKLNPSSTAVEFMFPFASHEELKTSTLQSSEQDKNWKNVYTLLKYIWTTQ